MLAQHFGENCLLTVHIVNQGETRRNPFSLVITYWPVQ